MCVVQSISLLALITVAMAEPETRAAAMGRRWCVEANGRHMRNNVVKQPFIRNELLVILNFKGISFHIDSSFIT